MNYNGSKEAVEILQIDPLLRQNPHFDELILKQIKQIELKWERRLPECCSLNFRWVDDNTMEFYIVSHHMPF